MQNYTLKVGEVFTDQKRKELQEYLELKDKEIKDLTERKKIKKWIHLRNLDTCPEFGIEGLTDYETILWLKELIVILEQRSSNTKIREYIERGC